MNMPADKEVDDAGKHHTKNKKSKSHHRKKHHGHQKHKPETSKGT